VGVAELRFLGVVQSPLAERETQAVHPRGDGSRPLQGVFATRSPARPNPIGLHRVTVTAISGGEGEGRAIEVDALEALDATPILDLKPLLGAEVEER
jgi:tRNA (Thr-GGU) A37 N-methylase